MPSPEVGGLWWERYGGTVSKQKEGDTPLESLKGPQGLMWKSPGAP